MPRRRADEAMELEGARGPAPLVFVDMPHCGGAAFDLGMPPSITGRREGRDDAPPLPGIFVGGGGISEADMEELREATRALTTKSQIKGVRMLRGSFPLAIANYLDRFAWKRTFRYFTVLRDPVDRVLAEYAAGPQTEGIGVEDAVRSGAVHDNLQTRMLSGSLEPFGEPSDEMLEDAKRNLRERLTFFALAERIADAVVLGRDRLGLTAAAYHAELTVPAPPGRDELSPGARKLIRRRNRYDVELYAHAQELFDAHPELSQLEFHCEAAALRAASRGKRKIAITTPMPESFEAGQEAWEMLVRARAECLRLEWELEGVGPAPALVGAADA
jgi:hypothetical protein